MPRSRYTRARVGARDDQSQPWCEFQHIVEVGISPGHQDMSSSKKLLATHACRSANTKVTTRVKTKVNTRVNTHCQQHTHRPGIQSQAGSTGGGGGASKSCGCIFICYPFSPSSGRHFEEMSR